MKQSNKNKANFTSANLSSLLPGDAILAKQKQKREEGQSQTNFWQVKQADSYNKKFKDDLSRSGKQPKSSSQNLKANAQGFNRQSKLTGPDGVRKAKDNTDTKKQSPENIKINNDDSILEASQAPQNGHRDDFDDVYNRGREHQRKAIQDKIDWRNRQQSLEKKLKMAAASLDMNQILEAQETRDDFEDS